MTKSELTHLWFRPSGDRLLTPPLGDTDTRLVLQGVFTFQYNEEQFDALHRTGAGGAFSQRHTLLQWSPRPPQLESADVGRHRYQFRIPGAWKLHGQSIGVRLDVDRLVDEFLIPPSEVRAALTGEMELQVFSLPAVAGGGWTRLWALSAPVALAAGGLGWILQRRMALAGLPVELQLQMDRIVRKQRTALAALEAGPARYHRLSGHLKEVGAGAWSLARRIGSLRDARSRIDEESLSWELLRLEQDRLRLTDAETKAAAETALGEKRKTLAALREIGQSEARCALRLTTLEASLDLACLTFRQLQREGPIAPAVESVRRELEAEVAAIAEEEAGSIGEWTATCPRVD